MLDNFRKQQALKGPKTPQYYNKLYGKQGRGTIPSAMSLHGGPSSSSEVVMANKARFTKQQGSASVSRMSANNLESSLTEGVATEQAKMSTSMMPGQRSQKSERLLALQEKVHLRKI